MLQEKITYFENKGPANTADALKLAVEAARELGIGRIVLSTTVGDTAMMMADVIDHEGLEITVVTHAFGQNAPGTNPMPAETRQHLVEKGFNVCTAAHALSGAERCLSGSFGGVYPVEMIAHTLRMFGQGTKVCVEICAMAADAGYITAGESVVAVGGTGRGADTVMVLLPEISSKVLKTKIQRVICMPLD